MAKRGLLNRIETSEVLGTTVSNVRKLEKKGLLTNKPDASGRARYTRYSVDRLAIARGAKQPRRTQGQIDADVFRLLREGKSPGEIVEATKITMAKFRELYAVHKDGFRAVDESLAAEEEDISRELHERQMEEMEDAFQRRREKSATDEQHQAQELAEIEKALRERYGDLWGDDGEKMPESEGTKGRKK
jgi:DNA-binding transcriptional MerR regulator